ncbi:MAG TPA: hypothetical protein PKB15_05770 [Acidimicrobiia bacterium]|nr:hypothetical protein [Acidimicrobiia bacterium]
MNCLAENGHHDDGPDAVYNVIHSMEPPIKRTAILYEAAGPLALRILGRRGIPFGPEHTITPPLVGRISIQPVPGLSRG